MSGPCSMPNGDKSSWAEHYTLICDIHKYCYPDRRVMGRNSGGAIEIAHQWVTLREWLIKRNKLRTGKTR